MHRVFSEARISGAGIRRVECTGRPCQTALDSSAKQHTGHREPHRRTLAMGGRWTMAGVVLSIFIQE